MCLQLNRNVNTVVLQDLFLRFGITKRMKQYWIVWNSGRVWMDTSDSCFETIWEQCGILQANLWEMRTFQIKSDPYLPSHSNATLSGSFFRALSARSIQSVMKNAQSTPCSESIFENLKILSTTCANHRIYGGMFESRY